MHLLRLVNLTSCTIHPRHVIETIRLFKHSPDPAAPYPYTSYTFHPPKGWSYHGHWLKDYGSN